MVNDLDIYSPLNDFIPNHILCILYFYLFLNGLMFLYLFGKEKFLQPKPICPQCNEILKVIEISECPKCNTILEKNTTLKCPNCGKINFEQ